MTLHLCSTSLEDIFLWSDGTYCTREEYNDNEMNHMSDDFTVLYIDSAAYNIFFDIADEDYVARYSAGISKLKPLKS